MLESMASAENGLDIREVGRLIADIEPRVFLMHNVHEPEPVLFETRWTLSYLRGPLTGPEIARVMSARSAAMGEACRLELGFERYRFPGFSVPEGETAFSYLYQLAHRGLLRRYQPVTKRALSQLAHELDVIDRTNLAEFFLIVWDLMEFARRGKIIGQGRGSAGDSIVAYCLGITKVDPIEHKLLFERFINEARTLPDIDIDFDVNRREEVIQYLYTRYGADHAAMVCTIVTYRARSAVREGAKAQAAWLEARAASSIGYSTRRHSPVQLLRSISIQAARGSPSRGWPAAPRRWPSWPDAPGGRIRLRLRWDSPWAA